mmetsp:Transcript_19149/g.34039  ORF Transcript_19149/g.34039 Transcript_19149/m.34039 type:complete len:272 (-) Transcript_19149:1232-2047(-)
MSCLYSDFPRVFTASECGRGLNRSTSNVRISIDRCIVESCFVSAIDLKSAQQIFRASLVHHSVKSSSEIRERVSDRFLRRSDTRVPDFSAKMSSRAASVIESRCANTSSSTYAPASRRISTTSRLQASRSALGAGSTTALLSLPLTDEATLSSSFSTSLLVLERLSLELLLELCWRCHIRSNPTAVAPNNKGVGSDPKRSGSGFTFARHPLTGSRSTLRSRVEHPLFNAHASISASVFRSRQDGSKLSVIHIWFSASISSCGSTRLRKISV